jgi:RHS repeat-associated protein
LDSKIESIPESWNYDNKPTQILKGSATTTFTYDGNSQRVKKVSPNQNVLYFGELYEKRNEVGIMHVFAGNQRLASVRLDGTKQFYHTDHLGSTSIVTDQTGSKKEWNEFFPFGTYRVNIDYDASFPDVFHTYTGQEEDYELGLYNFKARLYDPLLGRFISPDSIVPDPADPQALNRYSYARNNPLIYKDPSGHLFTPYHFGIQLGVSLYYGRGFLSFKDAWEALVTDVYQGKVASEANLHAMRGEIVKGSDIYQTIDQAKEGTKILAEKNLQEGKYGVVGHGVQDAPGHKWQSMGDYSKSVWTWLSHVLSDIFPSPKTVWEAIENTVDLMENSQKTIDKVYGIPEGSSDISPFNQSGPSRSYEGVVINVIYNSNEFSFYNYSPSSFNPWGWESDDSFFWTDSWE